MWMQREIHRKTIRDLRNKNADIAARDIACGGETLTILYIKQLTDRATLSDFVIRPLLLFGRDAGKPLKAAEALDAVLLIDDCRLDGDGAKIETYVLDGMAVLLFPGEREYIVANTKKVQHRSITEPRLQYTLQGPRDCFVENLDVNLSLLRYRVKDGNLRVEYLKAGERSNTRIALLYIADIANDEGVNEIRNRVNRIDTDGVMASGEVQAFLKNNRVGLFPQMLSIERSDQAGELLLEGKALLLVEGSNLALAAPVTMAEFFYSCDDRYENKFFGMFARLIRYAAFFLSFTMSSYWVATVSFHPDVLPSNFIIALAQSRSNTPFSSLIGALALEFMMELIRESLIHVPEKIGSAIAIVGAIIIGQAGIASGVFSPLLLIIISVEFLASFAIPHHIMANPLRIVKMLLLLLSSMFGFYGLILGITVVVVDLVSVNNFGMPFLAPYGPFNLYDFLRTFLFNRTVAKRRQQHMRTKDNTRSGGVKDH